MSESLEGESKARRGVWKAGVWKVDRRKGVALGVWKIGLMAAKFGGLIGD